MLPASHSGCLASQIASILRGKNKPTFEPHIDGGDFVEVTNCDKIKFTGKLEQKEYLAHKSSRRLENKEGQRCVCCKSWRSIEGYYHGHVAKNENCAMQ